jgi:two-component system response regulator PilR (NtrC family)
MARILLIDDNPDVLVLFEEILLIAGYQVDTGETFQAADDLLSLGEYDLLVTGSRVPDGTGMVLADKAKERGIAALIVTGFLHPLHRGNPGIEDHYTILQKPLTPNDLLAAVSSAIGRAVSPKNKPQSRVPHGIAQVSWVDMIATDRE